MKIKYLQLILIIVLSFSSLFAQEIIPIDRTKLNIEGSLEHVKVNSTNGDFEGYAYGVDEFNLFLLDPKSRNILKLHYSEIVKVKVNTDNARSLYTGGLTLGLVTGLVVGIYTPSQEDDYYGIGQVSKGIATIILGGLTGLITSGMIIRTESYIVETSKEKFDYFQDRIGFDVLNRNALESIKK